MIAILPINQLMCNGPRTLKRNTQHLQIAPHIALDYPTSSAL